MKFAVVTFGCRVNQADSLAIEGSLRARGAEAVPAEQADVVIVNTCSVTASADQGARQSIRRIVRSNPHTQVIVTGCYATRRPDALGELPNVTQIVPNGSKDSLAEHIARGIGMSTAERFGAGDGACGAPLVPGTAGRTTLTLRVQTGCDERCSYCIIPKTRGTGRSRAVEDVVHAVRHAVAAGYKEITIAGVHLGSYGRDLGDGSSLVVLMRNLIAHVDGEVLFRISSLEPMDCTPELIELAEGSSRIAPHFHLPLQHGADSMLRAMRRPYTVADYRRLMDRLHAALPHACIGSDIIVGFPGEQEREVEEMCGLLQQLPLSYLHVFPYSDRPGTEATAMPCKVDGVAIRERGRRVRRIGERMTERFRESQVGRSWRALTVDDGWSAVTANYLKVKLDRHVPRNAWVDVRITASAPLTAAVGTLSA